MVWVKIIFAVYASWNVIVFGMYGIDKMKAKKAKWRISENVLTFSAILMGGLGAIIGMIVFRHKTNHLKFRIVVPIALLVNIAIMVWIVWFVL